MKFPFSYLAEVNAEMKKVRWPKVSEVLRLTVTVLIISGIIGVYLGAIDIGFTKLLEQIILK